MSTKSTQIWGGLWTLPTVAEGWEFLNSLQVCNVWESNPQWYSQNMYCLQCSTLIRSSTSWVFDWVLVLPFKPRIKPRSSVLNHSSGLSSRHRIATNPKDGAKLNFKQMYLRHFISSSHLTSPDLKSPSSQVFSYFMPGFTLVWKLLTRVFDEKLSRVQFFVNAVCSAK